MPHHKPLRGCVETCGGVNLGKSRTSMSMLQRGRCATLSINEQPQAIMDTQTGFSATGISRKIIYSHEVTFFRTLALEML
jgi:hypothetical protein